jgi:hypothetical protein
MIQFVSFGELEIGQNSARLLSDALLAMISYKNWAIIGLAYGPTRGLAECGLTTYSPRAGPKYLCQSHFRTTVSSVTRYKSAIGTRPVQYARSISLYYASEAEL